MENEKQNADFPEVLKKIDWTTLRTQKTTLLQTMDFLEKSGIKWHESVEITEIINDLTGILHLIDALQDFAVDEMGVNSIHVFDFEEEDKREGYNGDLTPATPAAPATQEPVASQKYKVWVEIERIDLNADGDEIDYHDEECPVGIAYRDTLQGARVLRDTIETNFGEI